jgi:hypothetical protein
LSKFTLLTKHQQMKPMIYSAAVALLVLSSCSSAYKTAQTPDDVYYSPARERVYANNTARNTDEYAEETYTDNEGDDNYVTYSDEDEERYDYARRIDRFSRGYNGNYWDGYYFDDFYGPSIYVNNYWGSGWNRWGSYWGPSISFGLGWGYNPWGWNSWYGGWGNPWYGSGWYHPGYYSYYPGWYGGGYGGGWHGGGWAGGYYNPRPANSWGPRGSSTSRIFDGNRSNYTPRPNNRGSAPIRTFDRSSGNNVQPGNVNDRSTNRYTPRRTFQSSPNERPVTQPNRQVTPSRTFDRSDSRPAPDFRQSSPAPQRQSSPAPSRTFERSSPPPSNNSGSNSSGTPARTFRPRGG